MPAHDWTKADAGLFHAFALSWLLKIDRALNRTLLPKTHYVLIAPAFYSPSDPSYLDPGPDPELAYIRLQQRLTIHAMPGDRLVATVELPESGLKRNPGWLRTFALRLRASIETGVSCMVLDVLPRTPVAPRGIHPLVWSPFAMADFPLYPGKPFTLASYSAGPEPAAYVDVAAVGDCLPDMPLFLTPDEHVNVPLEATYQAAWAEVPERWREVLEGPTP